MKPVKIDSRCRGWRGAKHIRRQTAKLIRRVVKHQLRGSASDDTPLTTDTKHVTRGYIL